MTVVKRWAWNNSSLNAVNVAGDQNEQACGDGEDREPPTGSAFPARRGRRRALTSSLTQRCRARGLGPLRSMQTEGGNKQPDVRQIRQATPRMRLHPHPSTRRYHVARSTVAAACSISSRLSTRLVSTSRLRRCRVRPVTVVLTLFASEERVGQHPDPPHEMFLHGRFGNPEFSGDDFLRQIFDPPHPDHVAASVRQALYQFR